MSRASWMRDHFRNDLGSEFRILESPFCFSFSFLFFQFFFIILLFCFFLPFYHSLGKILLWLLFFYLSWRALKLMQMVAPPTLLKLSKTHKEITIRRDEEDQLPHGCLWRSENFIPSSQFADERFKWALRNCCLRRLLIAFKTFNCNFFFAPVPVTRDALKLMADGNRSIKSLAEILHFLRSKEKISFPNQRIRNWNPIISRWFFIFTSFSSSFFFNVNQRRYFFFFH